MVWWWWGFQSSLTRVCTWCLQFEAHGTVANTAPYMQPRIMPYQAEGNEEEHSHEARACARCRVSTPSRKHKVSGASYRLSGGGLENDVWRTGMFARCPKVQRLCSPIMLTRMDVHEADRASGIDGM